MNKKVKERGGSGPFYLAKSLMVEEGTFKFNPQLVSSPRIQQGTLEESELWSTIYPLTSLPYLVLQNDPSVNTS